MPKIHDISVPIFAGMPIYPGDYQAAVEPIHQISQGDTANLSALHLGTHTGTHVDAPHHFEDGRNTVDRLPLESLVGPARVLDLTAVAGAISAADLKAAGASEADRVLLKTGNAGLWRQTQFDQNFIALANDAADYLLELGVKLVGIDYLSIERFQPEDYYVHHSLLKAEVVVLEGLDLSAVPPGDYQLVCLPLRIKGGDGAPARAILIESQL